MGKILRFLTSRLFITIILFCLELILLVNLVMVWSTYSSRFSIFFKLLSIVVSLLIMTRNENAAYKLVWMLIVSVFPSFGAVLYLLCGNKRIGHRAMKKIEKYERSHKRAKINHDVKIISKIGDENLRKLSRYILNRTESAPCENSRGKYFDNGDEFLTDLLSELEKAKRFIFIEYFIIAEGKVWEKILSILERKAGEGLDIRVMYDDVGSINALPYKYYRQLRKKGIKAIAFNPVKWHFNPRLNFRDHRKILSIDGNVCYTGGLNLADEYMNKEIRFGYWKDNAIKLEGDVVFSMTTMFIELWDAVTDEEEDINLFRPTRRVASDGVMQAFGSGPYYNDSIGENAYLALVNNAKKYLYITTPYLIPDDAMILALRSASESGVDVRIVTPRYPDKKQVFEVTRSNYEKLLDAGVRIYEYLPGFVHTKMFLSDDEVAIVGTTNLDYRSFFLHFELSVVFYSSSIIREVKDDMIKIMDFGEEVNGKFKERNPIKRCFRFFYGLFSPAL